MSASLAESLADHAVEVVQTEPAAAALRLLAADYLALARTGARTASSVAARAAIDPAESGFSRIEGLDARVAAEDAALANGVAAHGLEMDDTHEESSSHPGVAVWPAVLAVADTMPVTLGEVLEAGGAGYDVMTAAGVLIGGAETYDRGFHPTAIAGALGAAAAVARLLGLNRSQMRDAIAIAADMAAGSLQFLADGSWTKRLNAGHAAAVGIRAARLGAAGFRGPVEALEGQHGWLRLYGRGAGGRSLELKAGYGALTTSVKFFPCCRYMHGVMDLLVELRGSHPGLDPADVDRIDVAVIEAGQTLVSQTPESKLRIRSTVDAQFSMPFGGALALSTGAARLADFEDAERIAPDLAPWMERMHTVTSPRVEAVYPAAWAAEVSVSLRNGKVIELREAAFRGSPARPASVADIRHKAGELCGEAGTRVVDRLVGSAAGTPWDRVRNPDHIRPDLDDIEI